jgi:hypothetical protein
LQHIGLICIKLADLPGINISSLIAQRLDQVARSIMHYSGCRVYVRIHASGTNTEWIISALGMHVQGKVPCPSVCVCIGVADQRGRRLALLRERVCPSVAAGLSLSRINSTHMHTYIHPGHTQAHKSTLDAQAERALLQRQLFCLRA